VSFLLSRLTSGKGFILVGMFALIFAACGDSDSDFVTRPDDGSSGKSSLIRSSSSAKSSSSYRRSSSSLAKATPCKTKTEDECEYGSLTDKRDGQTYKTVKIGDQWWMAENLNYAVLTPTADEDSSSFCFNNYVANCDAYGRLYTWAVAVGKSDEECGYGKKCSLPEGEIQGICPDGWHLPNYAEVVNLLRSTSAFDYDGHKLVALSGWEPSSRIPEGSDDFGFSALPAGTKMYIDDFRYAKVEAYFWSSTEFSDYHAVALEFNDDGNEYTMDYVKLHAYSVRCVQNLTEPVEDEDFSKFSFNDPGSVTLAEPCKTKAHDECEYGTLADDRDGQVYKTVKVGDQWWMAENLNYAYTVPTETLDSSSFCYKNDSAACDTLGRLYTWSAAMDSAALFSASGKGCGYDVECFVDGNVRGVCPKGWHLPDSLEFENLVSAVGGSLEVSLMLKSTTGWKYDRGKRGGVDIFGFTARPAGLGLYSEKNLINFWSIDNEVSFWSSTRFDSTKPYCMSLRDDYDGSLIWNGCPSGVISVRCVKD